MKKLNKPYLNDILRCISKIEKYISNFSFNRFNKDTKTQDAVFRNIEIIGEASGRLTKEFLKQYPNVEISKAKGMRNRLIHDYDKIDVEIVWDTIKNDVPELKKQVLKIKRDLKE
jgi:uncharacterized protein with HEPN domain